MAVDMMRCDLCHGLEPLCTSCQLYQAFEETFPYTLQCAVCEEEFETVYLGPAIVDPMLQGEARYYCEGCLPKECIKVREDELLSER